MSIADEIMKLDALRKQGAITDDEFERQKQALLSAGAPRAASGADYSDWSQVPLKNKWWFQWLITMLVIPVGLVLIACFKAYRKKQDEIVRVGVGFKTLFAAMMLTLWGIGISTLPGGSVSSEAAECDSATARAVLANAVQQNTASNIATLRLLDVRGAHEISSDPAAKTRRCNATLVLNSGEELVGYTLSRTSGGDHLVMIEEAPFQAPQTPADESIQETRQDVIQPVKQQSTEEYIAEDSEGPGSQAHLRATALREQVANSIGEIEESCGQMMNASDMRQSAEYAGSLLDAYQRLGQLGAQYQEDLSSQAVACLIEAQLRVQGR